MVEQTAREKQVLRKQKISDGWLDISWSANPTFACIKVIAQLLLGWMLRMKNTSALDNYIFHTSQEYDNDLQDKPGQIYNMDESGMPLDHRSIAPQETSLRLPLLGA